MGRIAWECMALVDILTPVGCPHGVNEEFLHISLTDMWGLAAGADIDTLCISPKYVQRDIHFFGEGQTSLQAILQVQLLGHLPHTPPSPQNHNIYHEALLCWSAGPWLLRHSC